MNRTEIYESEKKVMFDKMDKSYPNWRASRRAVSKVKAAARQSAQNMANAIEIGQLAGVPAKDVMRQAIALHEVVSGSIDTAFDVIRQKLIKTRSWDAVVKFVMEKSAHVPEEVKKEVFYNA